MFIMPPADVGPQKPPLRRNKLSTNRKRKLSVSQEPQLQAEADELSVDNNKKRQKTDDHDDDKMNNRSLDSYSGVKNPGISALCNLGNTCFLNSVLYTLRFTPGFCHNLHHLHEDIVQANGGPGRGKASSWTSNNDDPTEQELVADVIETLHVLFKALCAGDSGGEQIQPSSLLHSIGRLSPLFEGNQQQDAHELLVTLLNTLQDVELPSLPPQNGTTVGDGRHIAGLDGGHVSEGKKLSKKKSSKNFLQTVNGGSSNSTSSLYSSNSTSTSSIPGHSAGLEQNGIGNLKISDLSSSSETPTGTTSTTHRVNFVKEDFVGKSTMKTRCLECETSTFRSETFTNIDIPVHVDDEEDENRSNFFQAQILASETVRDGNKYWCSECSRLNEARRTVQYENLPNVLVLQLKRFTTTGTKYLSKITDFIPTPFTMDCFCVECRESRGPPADHKYQLYAVILHLGASLASGHYIAYVRAGDTSLDYFQCRRPSLSPNERGAKPAKKGLFNKMFSKSASVPSRDAAAAVPGGGGGVDHHPVCASLGCCGLKVNNVTLENNTNDVREMNGGGMNGGVSNGSLDSSGYASHTGTPVPEDYWLECDDEQISVMTRRQFEGILSTKQSATTPYLLFYHKIQ